MGRGPVALFGGWAVRVSGPTGVRALSETHCLDGLVSKLSVAPPRVRKNRNGRVGGEHLGVSGT